MPNTPSHIPVWLVRLTGLALGTLIIVPLRAMLPREMSDRIISDTLRETLLSFLQEAWQEEAKGLGEKERRAVLDALILRVPEFMDEGFAAPLFDGLFWFISKEDLKGIKESTFSTVRRRIVGFRDGWFDTLSPSDNR